MMDIRQQVEYQEIQSAPKWTWALSFCIIIVLLLLVYTSFGSPAVPEYFNYIWVGILILFIFIMMNFLRMRVVITSEELVVSYGFLHHRVPRSAISKIEQIKLTFRNTGGIGIRVSSLGYTIYNTRWGKALRIDRNDGEKSFGFTSDNPEQIISILLPKRI